MAIQAEREIVNDYVQTANSLHALKLLDRIIEETNVTPNYDDFKAKLAQMKKELIAQ